MADNSSMKTGPAPNCHYTLEEKERVLWHLAFNRWNKTRTAEETGVPRGTIIRWFSELTPDDIERYENKVREGIEPQLRRILDKLAERIERESEKIPLTHLPTAFGIVFDKHQLLTGGATENVGSVSARAEDIVKEIDNIFGGAQKPSRSKSTVQ